MMATPSHSFLSAMSAFLRLLCLLTIFLLPAAHADDGAPAPALVAEAATAIAPSQAAAVKTAPLMFANRKVFVFRAALAGYPPEERARGRSAAWKACWPRMAPCRRARA